MYIDPPYVLGARRGPQYREEMTDADHQELLEKVVRSDAMIMISGYPSKMYDDRLCGWWRKEFYSHAMYGGKRTEVIWMNYEYGQMALPL